MDPITPSFDPMVISETAISQIAFAIYYQSHIDLIGALLL